MEPPPAVGVETAADAVQRGYGFTGRWSSLSGERDLNFRLSCADGREYVVKIANTAEPASVTDLQIRVLQHLERAGCAVPVPAVVPARDGATSIPVGEGGAVLRVVSWMPGQPVAERRGTGLAFDMGRSLAALGAALQGFAHPADGRALLWDLQRADELRQLLGSVPGRLAGRVEQVLADFEERAVSRLAQLPRQVVHGDFHPGNVLADDAGTHITGVIDFGDVIRAPVIADVAIAAAYQRGGGDMLDGAASFVAGYDSLRPLDDGEIGLLYDLVRARLAASITIHCWREAAAGRGADIAVTAPVGGTGMLAFLDAVEAAGREDFTARLDLARGVRPA